MQKENKTTRTGKTRGVADRAAVLRQLSRIALGVAPTAGGAEEKAAAPKAPTVAEQLKALELLSKLEGLFEPPEPPAAAVQPLAVTVQVVDSQGNLLRECAPGEPLG